MRRITTVDAALRCLPLTRHAAVHMTMCGVSFTTHFAVSRNLSFECSSGSSRSSSTAPSMWCNRVMHPLWMSTRSIFTSCAPRRCSVGTPPQHTTTSVAALQTELDHVREELQHTREVVRQLIPLVDLDKHREKLAHLERFLEGGGGLFVAQTSDQLRQGLQTPGARIVLMEGCTYVLDLYQPVQITRSHISILGNNSTIIGSLELRQHAVLDASHVTFFCPGKSALRRRRTSSSSSSSTDVDDGQVVVEGSSPAAVATATSEAVLSATMFSNIFLSHCRVVNGRDGVYAGLQSRASLHATSIINCTRGTYEGVGCSIDVDTSCRFAGNYYHMVMLGTPDAQRATHLWNPSEVGTSSSSSSSTSTSSSRFVELASQAEVSLPGFSFSRPFVLRRARADVVLDHDPIGDVYAATWRGGQPVQLSAEESTAGLTDPVF